MPSPIAYLCSEFGVDASLPIYSGGLGVLAGDTVKEASDARLPFVGFGLFYSRGYFRQRLDLDGKQLEYWLQSDPKRLPISRVSLGGTPLKLAIEAYGAPLDLPGVARRRRPCPALPPRLAGSPRTTAVAALDDRTALRGTRAIRLAQYALLGIGAVRTMEAIGIDPGVIHLNEGHPALAALELTARDVAAGASFDDAFAATARRFVFTTHTPVEAGNETYPPGELLAAFGGLPARLGIDEHRFLGLFRTNPSADEPGGLTQLALRASRRRNAVSALHGDVARAMWRPFFGGGDTPITHVTNGVHLPTFLSVPFRRLYDRHLGEDWATRAADAATWEPIADVPDAELWAARCEARAELIAYARGKSEADRLQRGEQIDYVQAAARALDPSVLTLGFARRLATYKRVYLLARDPDRLKRILTGTPSVQLLLAGKAHPRDDEGKAALRSLFELKRSSRELAERMVVLEDYDLTIGRQLVAGCDVWLNLPRRPMEASGTSGMKTILNGAIQLSVLDGWWAEAFDGENGWGIAGDAGSEAEADERDAVAFYDLLEHSVVPLFSDRGVDGVPHAWCAKMKTSIRTCAPQFTATRMLQDYLARVYPVAS